MVQSTLLHYHAQSLMQICDIGDIISPALQMWEMRLREVLCPQVTQLASDQKRFRSKSV